ADTHKPPQHSNGGADKAISENPMGLRLTIPHGLESTICESAIKNERVQEILRQYRELKDFKCIKGSACRLQLRYSATLHDQAYEIQSILEDSCPVNLSTKI